MTGVDGDVGRLDGLPDWVQAIRRPQITATEQIVEKFRGGADVVLLDAPVGSGKTLLSQLVARELGITRSTYVAHSLSLQEQFLGDFADRAKVLKGRGNYSTLLRPDYTAADCGGKSCGMCEPKAECPYLVAKREAVRGEVAVINTAYLLAFQAPLFIRDLVVIDEADVLEASMLGRYELHVGARRLAGLGLTCPAKGVREATILKWLEGALLPAAGAALEKVEGLIKDCGDEVAVADVREQRALSTLVDGVAMVLGQIPEGRPWVREYVYGAAGDFKLKPVEISAQGGEMLWRRGLDRQPHTKWLAMSGSFVDGAEWAESVGVEAAGLKWDEVTVPMTWPKEDRPVVFRPIANMKKAEVEVGLPKMVKEVTRLVTEEHVGENVLVHTVSYAITKGIVDGLRKGGVDPITYSGAGGRDAALERFKEDGGVIVAPSLDRGVDLPGDLCTVAIVTKVPYPSLGDPQIRERMALPGGQTWYAVQVARSLIQMAGRGVRFDGDKCVMYVLDEGFVGWFRRNDGLLPRYLRDAVVGTLPDGWKGRKGQRNYLTGRAGRGMVTPLPPTQGTGPR